MGIELTPENLLVQLGYPVKEATLSQLERIIKNTDGFDKFAKILYLSNDEIKKYSCYLELYQIKRIYFKNLKVGWIPSKKPKWIIRRAFKRNWLVRPTGRPG